MSHARAVGRFMARAGGLLRPCDDCGKKAWTEPDETDALWFVCETCDHRSRVVAAAELERANAFATQALCLLFVAEAHKRGGPPRNAPLGIWAAEFAGTYLGGVAFEAATLARQILEGEDP